PSRRYKITNNAVPGMLVLNNLDRAPFQESAQANFRDRKRKEAVEKFRKIINAPDGEAVMSIIEKVVANSIESEFLKDFTTLANGETNTGAPVTIYNFMSFCVQEFPAKHYMVVLSGHGGGTEPDFLMKDESPLGSLTIPELKQAFVDIQGDLKGQKIDILGFDSCLMSMAEVCYELREQVDI